MKKKLFVVLFFLGLLFFFAASFYFSRQQTTRTETVPGITEKQWVSEQKDHLLTPPFPDVGYNASTFSVSLASSAAQPTQPVVLQVDTAESLRPSLLAFAKSLGFTTAPKEVKEQGVHLLNFTEGQKQFSFSFDDFGFVYYSGQGQEKRAPLSTNDTFFVERAKALLSPSLFPKELTLAEPKILYAQGEGSYYAYKQRSLANRVVLEYRLALDGVPVFASSPNDYAYSFLYAYDGTLISFSGIFVPVVKDSSPVTIIDATEAQTRIQNPQGRMVTVFSQNADSTQTVPNYSFTSVSGNGSFQYYFDHVSLLLTPVFVFSGTTTDANTKETILVSGAVSAVNSVQNPSTP